MHQRLLIMLDMLSRRFILKRYCRNEKHEINLAHAFGVL